MMNVTLTRHTGQSGRQVSVDKRAFVIGREEGCDLRIDSPLVSRRHCLLFVTDDGVVVRDLESRNGTHINQKERVVGSRRLPDGDRLWLGPVALDIRIQHKETHHAVVH